MDGRQVDWGPGEEREEDDTDGDGLIGEVDALLPECRVNRIS